MTRLKWLAPAGLLTLAAGTTTAASLIPTPTSGVTFRAPSAGPHAANAATQPSEAWIGSLQVLQQQGLACQGQPATPYTLKVAAAGLSGRQGLIIWGPMQTMRALAPLRATEPTTTEATWVLEVLGEPGASGTLGPSVRGAEGLIQHRWQEPHVPGTVACAFTSAVLSLAPADEGAATPGTIQALAGLLQTLAEAEEGLLASRDRASAQMHIAAVMRAVSDSARLQTTATAGVPSPSDLPDRLLRLGGLVRTKGDTASALQVTQEATRLYRLDPSHPPVFVAQSLLQQAGLEQRVYGLARATAVIEETLNWLDGHALADSDTAADAHALLGGWLMRAGHHAGARVTLERALSVQERRQASGTELALAHHQLAQALLALGLATQALQQWQQGLQQAQRDMPDAEGIQQTIQQALRQANTAHPGHRGA